MADFDKLELSTETLRELTHSELGQVAGGTVGAVTRTCFITPTVAVATALVTYTTKQVDTKLCG
jgi:hypothetical protein